MKTQQKINFQGSKLAQVSVPKTPTRVNHMQTPKITLNIMTSTMYAHKTTKSKHKTTVSIMGLMFKRA